MKQVVKDFVFCATLACLCTFRVWANVLTTYRAYYLFHDPVSPRLFLNELVGVWLLTGVLFAACRLVRRFEQQRAGRWAVLLLVLGALNGIRPLLPNASVSAVAAALRAPTGAVLVALLVLAGSIAGIALLARRRGWSLLRDAVLCFAPLFAVINVEAVAAAVRFDRLEARYRDLPPRAAGPARKGPRVVWMVFDELDYDVALSPANRGRFRALERLRQESFDADNAYAPSSWTILSLPSLLLGRPLDEVRLPSPDVLEVEGPGQPSASMATLPNVFRDARSRGVDSALIGWAVPHCRILGNDVSRCFWVEYQPPAPTALSWRLHRQLALLVDLMPGAWRSGLTQATGPACCNPHTDSRSAHWRRYQEYMPQARAAAADPAFGLVVLHLPVPHQPLIRDDEGRLQLSPSAPASYVGNVTLADEALGDLRAAMESAGLWESTTVVVTSDHFFRPDSFFKGATWGREPGTAREHRVPFLVRVPGDHPHVAYAPPFTTWVLANLTLGILDGKVDSARGIASWLDAHAAGTGPVSASRPSPP